MPLISVIIEFLIESCYFQCLNYSMHDYSRDIMLATAQEHIETRMLLSAAENKSREMEESLKKLEEITKKTDEILYQMIPKAVADRLRLHFSHTSNILN